MSNKNTNINANGDSDSRDKNNEEAGNRLPFPSQRKYRDLENFEDMRKRAEEYFWSTLLAETDPLDLDEVIEIADDCVARTKEHDAMIDAALRRINEAQCAADASFGTDQQRPLEQRAEKELQDALSELRFLLKPIAREEFKELADNRFRRLLEVLAESPEGRMLYCPMTEGDLRLELLSQDSHMRPPVELFTAPTGYMFQWSQELQDAILEAHLNSNDEKRDAEERLYKCFLKHAKNPQAGHEALCAHTVRPARTDGEEVNLCEALRTMNEAQHWLSERARSLSNKREEKLNTAIAYNEGVHRLEFEKINHLLQPLTLQECRSLIESHARRMAHVFANSSGVFPKKPDLTEDDLRLYWLFGTARMDC